MRCVAGPGLLVGAGSAWLARLPASSMLTATSWTILVATLVGLVVAQTPLARFPRRADDRRRAAAVRGRRARLAEQLRRHRRRAAVPAVRAQQIIADPRAAALLLARVFGFDLYLCGIASLAHIGGVATTPVLAASYAPALVPVGICWRCWAMCWAPVSGWRWHPCSMLAPTWT